MKGTIMVDGAVLVSGFIVIAMVGFFALSLKKAWQFAHMQMHARLDLYPIPKEGSTRASYGGSYLEEEEWWTKPRHISRANEALDIIKEMIFIRKLFLNQRSLWWASYAFHLGIYVMLFWSILLLVSVVWNPAPYLAFVQAVGIVGFFLGIVGCLLLLIRRAFDKVLRKYTTALEYFNLFFILVVLFTGAVSWLFLSSPFEIAKSVFTLQAMNQPSLVSIHLVLLGLMFLYIPLSKMSHYVGKFFSFHRVLWDNDPNMAGSLVDRKFRNASTRRVQNQWTYSIEADKPSHTRKGNAL